MLTSLGSMFAVTSLDSLTLEPLPPSTRQRLLRFPLGSDNSALLPLEQIAEIFN